MSRTDTHIGYAFEQLIVSDSVQVLSPSKYEPSLESGGALSAYITLEDADIRYTFDGTTPTQDVGHYMFQDETKTLHGLNQIQSFKCIKAGVNNAIISITYCRE